jgi:hypothetical protein
VPSSIERTNTLIPAACVGESSKDQRSPDFAPRKWLEFLALNINALAGKRISFGAPLEPLVLIAMSDPLRSARESSSIACGIDHDSWYLKGAFMPNDFASLSITPVG